MSVLSNSETAQKYFVGLCSYVVKADLRQLQKKTRQLEYTRMQLILEQANKHNIASKRMRRSAEMWGGDVSPYTEENGVSAAEALGAYMDGLEEIISGLQGKDKELETKLTAILKNVTMQQEEMFLAVQKGVSPHKILILSKDFMYRFLGCKTYNQAVSDIIWNEFKASTNTGLLITATAYLVLLEYCEPFADMVQNNVPLFAFNNHLNTVTDAAGSVKVVHIVSEDDGPLFLTMRQSNMDTFVRQMTRYQQFTKFHDQLVHNFVLSLIRKSADRINAHYVEQYGKPDVQKKFFNHMAKQFHKGLFASVQKRFKRISEKNNELRQNMTTGGKNLHIYQSPLNGLIERISHNHAEDTKFAFGMKQDFHMVLKTVIDQNPDVREIMMSPEAHIKKVQAQRSKVEQMESLKQAANEETSAMDVEEDAAMGLVNTMNMPFVEAGASMQGLRDEQVVNIVVNGQYILTENNFLQYTANYPVIQIEKKLTGSVVVGLNEAAKRAGFLPNMFLTKIEEINFDEINEFLKSSAAASVKTTRFRAIVLGGLKEDESTEEELLDEVMDDSTDMLGDDFFGNLI